jgi:hypothetical protein
MLERTARASMRLARRAGVPLTLHLGVNTGGGGRRLGAGARSLLRHRRYGETAQRRNPWRIVRFWSSYDLPLARHALGFESGARLAQGQGQHLVHR